jgi:photosystem II stability/assembly factor-like uncharacterized protein
MRNTSTPRFPNALCAIRARLRLLVAPGLLAVGLAGCGGHSDDNPPEPPSASAVIGAAGGTLSGPDGVQLVVPPGALAADTTLRIARSSAGAPTLPDELRPDVPIYEVTPHDLAFLRPVQLRLPLRGAPQANATVFVASPTEPWASGDVSFDGNTAIIERSRLSWYSPLDGYGLYCAPRPGDPYPCILAAVAPLAITTIPAGAIAPPASVTDVQTITRSASLNFNIAYGAQRDCGNARLRVFRGGPGAPDPASPRGAVLLDEAVPMSPTPGSSTRSGGTRAFQTPVDSALNGFVSYEITFSCTRVFENRSVGSFTRGSYRVDVPAAAAPAITQQPTPARVSVVQNNPFTVVAAATGANLSYEWRYFQNVNDSAVRAAEGNNNQASYTSPPADLAWDGRLYYVQVCSNRGVAGTERCVTSQASPLSVSAFTQPTAFNAQPVSRDVLVGESASFGATVTGTPTPGLQWFYGVTCSTPGLGIRNCNGTAFADGAGSGPLAGAGVAGAATATLTLTSLPLAANGTQLALRATQPGGVTQWSDVVGLTVRTSPIGGGTAPTIVSQAPASATISAGGSATFGVRVAGSPAPTATWRVDTTTLTGGSYAVGGCSFAYSAVSSNDLRQITLSNVTSGCNGVQLTVALSNSVGSVASMPFTLFVVTGTAPSITAPPAGASATAGGSASFSVAATGTAPLAYLWTLNAVALPGNGGFTIGNCTGSVASGNGGASITLSSVSAGCDSAVIAVEVTGPVAPSASSTPVTLTVQAAPVTQGACFGGPTGWCYVQPSPNANELNSIALTSSGELVVAGRLGTLQRSADNGSTWTVRWTTTPANERHDWQAIALPTDTRLVGVSNTFNTFNEFGAVPAPQGIYSSDDGGASWTLRQATGYSSDVVFKNADVGVAVGISIRQTVDGGNTWTERVAPNVISGGAGNSLLRVAYAGNNTFVAVGLGGILWRSTDNGASWAAVTSGTTERLTDVSFNGNGIGLAVVNGPMHLLRTADFGASWQTVSTPGFQPAAVAFASAAVAAVLDGQGGAIRSIDAGLTWQAPNFDLDGLNQEWRMKFVNATTGIAVGDYGTVARTSDGGQTWTRLAGGRAGGGVDDLRARGGVVLAVMDGTVMRSTDSGLTWASPASGSVAAYSVTWANDSVALAYGNDGVYRSTDAGQNWSRVLNDPATIWNGGAANAAQVLAFGGSAQGAPFGTDTRLRRSTDGGATWNPVSLPGVSGSGFGLIAAAFANSSVGYVGGTGLWRTADGGATWTKLTLPQPVFPLGDRVMDIEVAPGGTLFVVTVGSVLRSENQGASFTSTLDNGQSALIRRVAFADASVGTGVGYGGIHRTADGGQTWTRLDLPLDRGLSSVTWVDADTALVGGEAGTLLRNQSRALPAALPPSAGERQKSVRSVPTATVAGTRRALDLRNRPAATRAQPAASPRPPASSARSLR